MLERSLALASGELESRVHVVRDFGPVPPVLANPAQLAQVFLNLVVNAAQAVAAKPSGEGEIRITTRANERGGAVVEVRDDGPGIDPATRERIFEPFLRTRPASTGSGSSLGLSVCHAIVLGAGGLLEVESEPGHGSLFRVVLPPAPAEEHLPPGNPGLAPIAPGRVLGRW
ncbi:MAG: hypothetical protein A2V77_20115 [Anaeromyxobacter sp. RBG_16_69_14]|nr:MAG: hypothetical protein A2V77_20115 [Anaeromyxobacter sp. RBG_16_69_14]